jgi:hypothetical protein
MPFLARSVRWEATFEAEIYAIEPDRPRADEILSGLDWVISRRPTHGVNIPGTDIWVDSIKDVPNMRQLFVFYRFSPVEVFFESVIALPLKKKNEP